MGRLHLGHYVGTLPGIDGNEKMGKSLNNAIYLSDSDEEIEKKIMSMYTDPNRIHPTDPGKVEGNPVFIYQDAFNDNKEEVEDLKERYQKGTVGDIEVKEKLSKAIKGFLAPFKERRSVWENNPDKVDELIVNGTTKARAVFKETLSEMKDAMGFDYLKI